jgi:SAM-dependent methyltransferase
VTNNTPHAFLLLVSMLVTPIALAEQPPSAEAPSPGGQSRVVVQTRPSGHPPLGLAIRRQQLRQEHIKLPTLIDALNVVAGMTILDIGSGPGYAAFMFAERLNGSGEVFATDIRRDFIDHIAEEAKKRNLSNLFSVTVKEDGFDEFYTKHRYDLVFLSNVYHCIDERVDYFSKLQKFLKPNARLVLVIANQVPVFSAEDFSRVDNVAKVLSSVGEESPFVKLLSQETRNLLQHDGDKGALKVALADDFNRALIDPSFYRNFYSNSYFEKDLFNAAERDLANWLLMDLEEHGILEKAAEPIDAKSMRTMIKLNRMFFMKRFGDSLANGGMGAYMPIGDANRHTSKYVMFRELAAAGYQVAEELPLSPYYDAVVMVPKQ